MIFLAEEISKTERNLARWELHVKVEGQVPRHNIDFKKLRVDS